MGDGDSFRSSVFFRRSIGFRSDEVRFSEVKLRLPRDVFEIHSQLDPSDLSKKNVADFLQSAPNDLLFLVQVRNDELVGNLRKVLFIELPELGRLFPSSLPPRGERIVQFLRCSASTTNARSKRATNKTTLGPPPKLDPLFGFHPIQRSPCAASSMSFSFSESRSLINFLGSAKAP